MPANIWYPLLLVTAALGLPVLALALFGEKAASVSGLVRRQSAAISNLSTGIGVTVAWLVVVMVVVQFSVVVMRYVFGVNFIALQESVLYAHGALFMLASAYTLVQGGHVRVDIVYSNLTAHNKAWVDLLGTMFFLIPIMLLILNSSWVYVSNSWGIQEASRESSGLQWLYLLKTVIIVFAGMMLLQGIGLAGKAALLIAGFEDENDEEHSS